ncbi:MAG: permease-like cell division protein FtsX [Defluviitaleaceae bacterium]|nr:permease-like cell division protein FtsX [Defluviitaleaceae bacterium]
MKPRTIKYYIREAFRSLIVNRLMSAASIFAVASSIFIVAVFYILGANVEYNIRGLEGSVGLVVFVDDSIGSLGLDTLEERINALPNVDTVRRISREEALEDFREWIADDALLYGLDMDNPLPNSFVIEVTDLALQSDVARALENLRPYGVERIRQDEDVAGMLTTLSTIVQLTSILLIFILGLISIIIITNTIRITVNARKTEINIMKYVGATDWFIRWPFVIEGMMIGLIGGAIPVGLTWFGYSRLVQLFNDIPQLPFLTLLPEGDIFMYVLPLALGLGTMIGIIGSSWSVKKHLKV